MFEMRALGGLDPLRERGRVVRAAHDNPQGQQSATKRPGSIEACAGLQRIRRHFTSILQGKRVGPHGQYTAVQ